MAHAHPGTSIAVRNVIGDAAGDVTIRRAPWQMRADVLGVEATARAFTVCVTSRSVAVLWDDVS
jgi:hypothetical protein